MGARNTRASQSPLHSEIEALIWAMECMRSLRQFTVTFATDCSQLVKLVSELDEMADLCKLFRRYKVLEEKFQQLRAHSYSVDA